MNYVGVKEILLTTTTTKKPRLFKHNAAAGVLHSLCKLPRSRRSTSHLEMDVGSKTATTGHVQIVFIWRPKSCRCGVTPGPSRGQDFNLGKKQEPWRRATEGMSALDACNRRQLYRECEHEELEYNLSLEGERTSMGPRASSWSSGPLDLQIWMDHIRNRCVWRVEEVGREGEVWMPYSSPQQSKPIAAR